MSFKCTQVTDHMSCLLYSKSLFECAQKRRTISYPFPDITFLVQRNLSVWFFCLFFVLFTQTPCSFKSQRDGLNYLNYMFENDNVLYSLHLDSHPLEIRSAHGQQNHSCVILRQNLPYLFLCCFGNKWLCMSLVAQSCPTLQPHGLQPARLPCPLGIFQARILEWVTCSPSGDLPNPGIKPRSPTFQADS